MKCKMLWVHLASDEWGNELMDRIAQEYFAEYPEVDAIEVSEHGGWWLTYRRDGQIVGTANDGWPGSPEIKAWWAQFEDHEFVGSIRRDDIGIKYMAQLVAQY